MCECAKNGEQIMCEKWYDFFVFIFLFTSDDPIIDKNGDIMGGRSKNEPSAIFSILYGGSTLM